MEEYRQQPTSDKSPVYIFRTLFNPIRGVDEDISEFISRFTACGSLRFTKFAELWRRERFIEIIYGRRSQAGLYDILGCVFHRLVDLLLPQAGKKQIEQICAVYMLYAFYGKQPVKNHVKIRVCPESWNVILQLTTGARDEGHLDVYYVFRQLCVLNAFAFCATRQVLYPGAPLFDSPQTKQDPLRDSESTTARKEKIRRRMSIDEDDCRLGTYLEMLQLQGTSRATLNDSLRSLDTSLLRYTEAKNALNPPSDRVSERIQGTEYQEGSPSEQSDETEEFLPGLNFITYPGSLKNVFDILGKLETVETTYLTAKQELTEQVTEDNANICDANNLEDPVFSDVVLKSALPDDPVNSQLDKGSTFTSRESRLQNRETFPFAEPFRDIGKEEDEVSDVGERRRLLRQPSTWSEELEAQIKAVRAHGHHRDHRRPTERKILRRRPLSKRCN